MAVVGFLGLGNMGGPMAANLVRAGHKVQGFDPDAQRRAFASASGVDWTGQAAAAVADAEAVVTMLPTGRHLLQIYEKEFLKHVKTGTVLIDCSTVDVASAHEAHEVARLAGLDAVDAPVSGGVAGAAAGTLTFMVGGAAAAFEHAQPYLAAMGNKNVYCGSGGAGQAAKICNNMILGISMIAISEAFVLGEHLGLSHEALFEVAASSSGQCWALTSYCPVAGPVPSSPANRDYAPGFSAALMLKDLRLAREAADKAGAGARLGRHAAQIYEAFVEAGQSNMDFSAIIKDIR